MPCVPEETDRSPRLCLRNGMAVDLTTLGKRLVQVVDETMQPTLVSLWLSPASSSRKPHDH